MKNIGHLWLEFAGMLSACDTEKVCLLAALELSIQRNLCEDTYGLVWEGNIGGNEASVKMLRRCVHKGYTLVAQLLTGTPVTVETLHKFLEEDHHGCRTSPYAG